MVVSALSATARGRPVRFVRRDRDWVMRCLAVILGESFMTDFWTTYRLPFQSCVTIAYPPDVVAPERHPGVVAHEMIHAHQFARFGAPLVIIVLAGLLPLPFLFSGRWFIERPAYLHDIRTGRVSLEGAVDLLWRRYGFAWPKPLMRRWFRKAMQPTGHRAPDSAAPDRRR